MQTEFEVTSVPRPVEHRIKFGDVKQWLNKTTVEPPAVRAKRATLRELYEASMPKFEPRRRDPLR